jgi:MFS family permease
MVPLVILAEKRRQMKAMCLSAIAAITLSLGGLAGLGSGLWSLFGWLLLFFVAFNLLEATLPSMLSKLAPAGAKGTAMGVYSTSQFLGAFLGGVLGGFLAQQWGLSAVFLGCALLRPGVAGTDGRHGLAAAPGQRGGGTGRRPPRTMLWTP